MLKKVMALAFLFSCAMSFADDWYVDAKTTVTPDGSQSAPWKTLADAIVQAQNGDVIHLADNQTHDVSAALTIARAVTVVGRGDTTVLRGTTATSITSITLNNAGATISRVKLTNSAANSSTLLNLISGTLDDCLVANASSGNARHTTLNAAGGTVRNCRFFGNHPKGYPGTYDAVVQISGSATFDNCLFWGNFSPNGGVSGTNIGSPQLVAAGAVDVNLTAADAAAQFENCTFADNIGHSAGAVRVKSTNKGTVAFSGCVIAGNQTYLDVSSRCTFASPDICLDAGATGSMTFEHCLIGRMPSQPNARAVFTDCWLGVAPGYADERKADFSLVKGSPAYGYGYNAGAVSGFACAIKTPATDRAVDSLTVPMEAKLFGAPDGTVAYAWDLDGDGVFETTDKGSSFMQTFTTPGWHTVGLRVSVGGVTAEDVCRNFVYVAPREILVRAKAKGSVFPYATEATATASPAEALAAALDGCVLRIGDGSYQLPSGGFSWSKKVRVVGNDGDPSKAVLTGAAREMQSIVGDGISLQGLTLSGGYPVLTLLGESVVSNCTVTGGSMSTADTGTGLNIRQGLFTHGRIHGNTGSNGGGWGLYITGGTVRNSLVYNNRTVSGTTAGKRNSAVIVAGGTVENCSICGNCAPTTATSGTVGGVEFTGAAVFRNNVVWGNTCPHPLTESANNWYVAAGVSTVGISNNCTETEGLGTDCYTDNPQFAAGDAYDFAITSASGCYNRGVAADWMDGATDFAGNARVQGGSVDIGAYEADASVVTLGIASELLEGGVGTATYRLAVTGDFGALPAGTRFLWDFDGDGTWDADGLTLTQVFGEGAPAVTLQAFDTNGNPVTEAVVRSDVVDVKALVVYVSAESANPAYPYNTPATAAQTLGAGYAAAGADAEIRVLPGQYDVELGAVARRLTIRSTAGANVTTLVGTPVCTLSHVDAVLEGFTLVPKYQTRGTGLFLQAGTVRDCRFSDFYHSTPGRLAIDASGGLIDRCEIRNCYNNPDTDSEGNYVYLGGNAVMRNSLLWRTPTFDRDRAVGGSAVYVAAEARMENCVVYDIRSLGPAVKNLGTVVNCIILNNIMTGASDSPGAPNWTREGEGSFSNCISTRLGDPSAVPGILVGNPDFTDPETGDFTISSASIAFNAGLNLDWMADAQDFYGRARLSGTDAEPRGGIVDIGLCEVDIHAPDLNVAVTPVNGLGATEVTFTAVPNAFELDPDASFKWYLKAEVDEGDVPDSTANPFVATLEAGTYSVTLLVTDADGQGTAYHRIKRDAVTIAPKAIFVAAGEDFSAKVAVAADGTTIHLGAGTHVVDRPFATAKAVTIVGAGRDVTFLVNAADQTNAVLSIGNAAARVSDLTIRDAGSPMLTVEAGGGTIENVRLAEVRDSSTTLGGALRLLGGTVKRSYVQDNVCAKSKAPVYLGGATAVLEDCLVTGNVSTGTGADAVGAIRLARGIVRNCTVVANRSAANAGGVVMTAEREASAGSSASIATVGLVNTIVWGNACDVGSLYDNLYFPPVTDNKYAEPNRYCLNNYTYPAISGGTANIGAAANPGLVAADHGDYSLDVHAPVRNKGVFQAWMLTAVDLAGSPRSKNPARGRVDIGCYETLPFGLLLILR